MEEWKAIEKKNTISEFNRHPRKNYSIRVSGKQTNEKLTASCAEEEKESSRSSAARNPFDSRGVPELSILYAGISKASDSVRVREFVYIYPRARGPR